MVCGVKNMNDDDKLKEMRKMLEVAKANHRVFEKTISKLLQFIKTDIPDSVLKDMIEPLKLSYESSKVNVERMDTFPSPVREGSISNFMFGKMFGKTELLLQIFHKDVKE